MVRRLLRESTGERHGDAGSTAGDRLVRLSTRHRSLFYRFSFGVAVVAFLAFTLAPLYYVLVVALTPHLQVGPLVPPAVSPEGFILAWRMVDWGVAFTNSMIITLGTLGLVLAVSVPAAYAFGRMSFPGRRPLLAGVVLLILFPKQGLAIELFSMFTTDITLFGTTVRLFNTHPAIIIPLAVYNVPIAVALLTVFFAYVPDDLEKAARVEGATRVQAFRHAVLPLARPGIASVAILVFVDAYTSNFFASFMTFGAQNAGATVQNDIEAMASGALVYPNALAAAGLIGLLPSAVVLLYMVGKLDTWLSKWGEVVQ